MIDPYMQGCRKGRLMVAQPLLPRVREGGLAFLGNIELVVLNSLLNVLTCILLSRKGVYLYS